MVKGPDGTVFVGTETKDKNSKEALCWNCQAHIVYINMKGIAFVKCHECKEEIDVRVNDKQGKTIIKC